MKFRKKSVPVVPSTEDLHGPKVIDRLVYDNVEYYSMSRYSEAFSMYHLEVWQDGYYRCLRTGSFRSKEDVIKAIGCMST